MSIKRQVAVGLKWQAINIVGRQFLSLIVFTTLVRLLDPAAFGLLGLIGVYLSFVGLFADQGLGTALVQRRILEPEHLDTVFWLSCGVGLLLCGGTIVLASPISAFFNEPRLVPLLQWSSLGLLISASSVVHSNLLVRALDFRRSTIRTLVANLAGGIIGVGMAVAGSGVWALVGQQLASALAGSIFLWSISDYRPSRKFSFAHLRDMLHVSSSAFGSTLLWFFSSRLDQIVIGRFIGVPTLGLYVVASKIPELAKFVTHQPVAEVSLPALSLLQHDHRRMLTAIYAGMELNALVAFAVFGGLISVSSDLVSLIFGVQWVAAAGLCTLLLGYALINSLLVFVHPSLMASGGAGRYILINVWLTLGVVVACLCGVWWGVESLVLGLIVNMVVVSVPALLFLRQRIGLDPLKYWQPCLVPACAAIVMALCIWLIDRILPFDTVTLLRLGCKISVGAVAYIGTMLMIAPKTISRMFETVKHAFFSSRPDRSLPVVA